MNCFDTYYIALSQSVTLYMIFQRAIAYYIHFSKIVDIDFAELLLHVSFFMFFPFVNGQHRHCHHIFIYYSCLDAFF